MWLTVIRSNNHSEIIAIFYLNCVAGLEGCPVKLRTDCGTENCSYAMYISTRCRSRQVWVISCEPKDWGLVGILQKKQLFIKHIGSG